MVVFTTELNLIDLFSLIAGARRRRHHQGWKVHHRLVVPVGPGRQGTSCCNPYPVMFAWRSGGIWMLPIVGDACWPVRIGKIRRGMQACGVSTWIVIMPSQGLIASSRILVRSTRGLQELVVTCKDYQRAMY